MTFGDIREVISQTELITLENEKFEQIKSTDLCMNILSYWNKFDVLAVYIHKQYKSLVIVLNTGIRGDKNES